jgi:hypothetical protein
MGVTLSLDRYFVNTHMIPAYVTSNVGRKIMETIIRNTQHNPNKACKLQYSKLA